LNRIFVAIQIAIESNRNLISPVTGRLASNNGRLLCVEAFSVTAEGTQVSRRAADVRGLSPEKQSP